MTRRAPPPRQLFSLSPGVGYSYQLYSQPGYEELRLHNITAKLSAGYLIAPPNWGIGANVFGTVANLAGSPQDVDFRVLGANFRIGYSLNPGDLGISPPWRLTLMAGYYYTTTFINSPRLGRFGYKDIMGPQIFPVFLYQLRSGGVWSTYVKYSPVSDGLSFLTPDNAEFAGGLSIRPGRSGLSAILYTLDLSYLTLQTTNGRVISASGTLGMALSL